MRGDGETYVDDVAIKTGNARTLTLDPATIEEIEALRAACEQMSPYLFSNTTDAANPDHIGWWWSRTRERSGIAKHWRLHDLRHWTATTAITSGHDVRSVAGRLGYSNPAMMTLRVYAQAVEGADRALASSVAATLDGEEIAVGQHPTVEHSTGMDVLDRLHVDPEAIAAFCRHNGIPDLAVFGSALRDDFTPESVVDLLVEFQPGQKVSLFDMARMEMELEEIIPDHRIDLRTAGDLSTRFRERVVAEAEHVYDAAA